LRKCNATPFKMQYKTRKKALKIKNAINKDKGAELKIYKCPDCNSYHLTSQKERITQ